MSSAPPGRQRLALVVALTTTAAVAAWLTTSPRGVPASGVAIGRGPIVLALAGDAALSVPLDLGAAGPQGVAALVRRASLGIANFELSAQATPGAPADAAPRWPSAVPEAAGQLRQLGFGAVSLANNHAFDAGADGLARVQVQLAAAGVAYAGAGPNLDAARQPAYVSTANGTVALVSVTLSHAAGARATARQGDINGRPGVNGLRFTRRLAVDAAAFDALARAFPPTVLKPAADGATWDLFGVIVERGAQGGMTLMAAPDDVAALVAVVRDARRRAGAVVVSLHAHEPGNRVDEVPELLRGVAHAVIDAGADLVHGHGPHRLRGIEMYRERPIFHSLGNVVFPDRGLRPEAADQFEDHGHNVLSPFGSEAPAQLTFDEDVWWQSAIAIVTLGPEPRVELHPLDLGIGQSVAARGMPAPASAFDGARILERLRVLSAALGTTIVIENGIGIVKH